jgi:tetratricopeptide (TPR) repeat protein
MLRRVSIFSGGWTLEAAEQVCVGEGVGDVQVLDLLTSLADKNLVVADEQDGATRYRLLETVRHYAGDRLRERAEEVRFQRHHLEYFVATAEEAEAQLTGSNQRAWLDRLETERDNLRLALSWSAAAGGDAAGGLRLAGALWRFWLFRGYLFEGRRWLAEQLAFPTDPSAMNVRAKALDGAGVLARNQGDNVAARQFHEESLAIQRERGDRPGIAVSLSGLGTVSLEVGDLLTGRSFLEQSLAIYRELGDRRGTANQLNNLGAAMAYAGDFPAARVLHEEALALRRDLGDRWGTAASLMNLAMVARNNGDLAAARELYQASESMYQELGDPRSMARAWRQTALVICDQGDYESAETLLQKSLASFVKLGDWGGICDSLYGLAYAFLLRDPRRAATLWGAGERLHEELGVRQPPIDRSRDERQVAAARAALGDDTAFDLAWQEGRAMNVEHAVRYALDTGGS